MCVDGVVFGGAGFGGVTLRVAHNVHHVSDILQFCLGVAGPGGEVVVKVSPQLCREFPVNVPSVRTGLL